VTAGVTLRPAAEADAEAICLIYNQGIEDRIATLETELRTPVERRHWLASRSHRHPVIVAEACVPERVGRSEPLGRAGDSPGARLVEPPERSEPLGRAGDSPGARPVVIGWGSLNQFNPRKAYEHVADFSVYVEREWRGKGVGALLLQVVVDQARRRGHAAARLNAQTHAAGFYRRFGFEVSGPEFMEAGIPHVPMQRDLNSG